MTLFANGYGVEDGWARHGALDFAGGTVVHIASGATALAAAIVLKKRRGFFPWKTHDSP